MKRNYPKTYSYLKQFETHLRKRASSSVRRLMDTGPFYSMFAVGPYTLSTWKVAWRDMGNEIQVAVASNPETTVTCPEHHVMTVATDSENEAHYVCASLMSSVVQVLVSGYTTTTGISTHVLSHVGVPKYDRRNEVHAQLATLSKACHSAALSDDEVSLRDLQAQIDAAAAKLWSITCRELQTMHAALSDSCRTQTPRRGGVAGRSQEADE